MGKVTWARSKPREEDKKVYRLPQDYGSVSEYLADRYPPVAQKTLPTRANVAFANLKRR